MLLPLPLLLSLLGPAQAEEPRYALVRRDAHLCDAPHDKGKCVQVASLAEPAAAWRDPWPGRVLQEDGDWLQVEGSSKPSDHCAPSPNFPAGVSLRPWVKRAELVPATTRSLSFEAGAYMVSVAPGVPVGFSNPTGAIGVAAKPFLGSLRVPEDATSLLWSPGPPAAPMPAGATALKIVYGYNLELGDQGSGSILIGQLLGVVDSQANTLTVGSACVVARAPMSAVAQSELAPAVPAAEKPAATIEAPLTLRQGTPVLWESGKPAGELHADVLVPSASLTAKGKYVCGPLPLTGMKRTMNLCFPKELVPVVK